MRKRMLAVMPLILAMASVLPPANLGAQADNGRGDFVQTIKAVERVPYNPRPLATNTQDVTGISTSDSGRKFLGAAPFPPGFTRISFPAPANGRTFKADQPSNQEDITLAGYIKVQKDTAGTPIASRPGILIVHGGQGNSSTIHGPALVDLANRFVENGYHVLAFDRRDGLLSRCAFKNEDLNGDGRRDVDPTRSQPSRVGGPPAENCDVLSAQFRDPSYTPHSLVSGWGAPAGDVLAAARYLEAQTGTGQIGALGSSIGGLAVIRAAAIQGRADTSFPANLLDAILALSPVADFNTTDYARSETFGCTKVDAARFYSAVPGAGIRNFTVDPRGAVDDFYWQLNGVKALEDVAIPTLVVSSLNDDTTTADGGLAYAAKTSKMKSGHTLLLARGGHGVEVWEADPFWVSKTALTYFRGLIAPGDSMIRDDPGFANPGPNRDNPLLLDLGVKDKDASLFLSQSRIAPYLVSATGSCPGYP